jgi:peptide/nickel transport system substrate-binding protein
MEKRFGIKDLFLFGLVGLLIVIVALAMWQFDRQFDQVKDIGRQNKELAGDVNRLKTLVAGVADAVDEVRSRPAVAAGPSTTQPAGTQPALAGQPVRPKEDAFTRLREAEKLPGFARGDWIVYNFGTKIGRLTPLVSSDVYQKWVESQVMEGMVDRDPQTLEYVPRLASRWAVSPDGLTMTFWLRRGVSFSDGHPLDADDVLFTFDWIRNPAIDAARDASYLTKLKSVRKVDQYQVEFTFSEFYYLNFSVVGSMSVLPKHFYSKYAPQEFNEKPGLMLGSGPYRLENPTDWTPTGKGVTLVRNERYWGEPPAFDRLVFKELQGEATQMVAFGNQEIDAQRFSPDQFKKLTADPRVMGFSQAMQYDDMYGGYAYCAWNQVRKADGKDVPTPFADKRVRQAMTMLLDRERVAKEIFLGYYPVSAGPFAPTGKQTAPDVKPWPFDEAKGKALLAEAGFKDTDGDGVLDGPGGKPFRFKLTYPSGNESTEKMVLFMKDAYARAGIVLEPDRVDFPVLIQRLKQSDFDACTLAWSSTPESDPYQIFHSSQIAGQGDNRTGYVSKELDGLIEKARVTVDEGERMKVWNQVHRVLHEDQPYTFLFVRRSLRLYSGRIKNIAPATIGINHEFLNGGIIPWFVPKGAQKYTQ